MEDKRLMIDSQVKKIINLLSTEVEIISRAGFPSLTVSPIAIVKEVKKSLLNKEIKLKDTHLSGSAASYCICEDSGRHPQIHYNDIDLVFEVEVRDTSDFHTIRQAVMETLADFFPHTAGRYVTPQLMEEIYVEKMTLVSNQENKWSLISLGISKSESRAATSIDLKFVCDMKRKYEFTVNSFQIFLDSYLYQSEMCSCPFTQQSFIPVFKVASVCGSYDLALYHLNNRLIHTKAPEEIRGGGLLKYCSLLVNGFKPANTKEISHLEPYMCSRFFIDFPTEKAQYAKIYAAVSRFSENRRHDGVPKAAEFLDTLKSIVQRQATVKENLHSALEVISYIRNQLSPQAHSQLSPPLPLSSSLQLSPPQSSSTGASSESRINGTPL